MTATARASHAVTPSDAEHDAVRRVGGVSAWIVVVLGALYVPTLGIGFVAGGGLSRPLTDPYLAVAEMLIVLMAPPLVVLAASVLLLAPPARRIWGLCGVGFMLLTVGTTVSVHLVELVVARRLQHGVPRGPTFGWDWPGVLYAVDVTAWDLFFGLAILAMALTLTGRAWRAARLLLVLAASLSLLGLVGPALDVIGLRMIGVVGYAIVFPIAAAVLGRRLLGRPGTAGTFVPGPVPR